MNDTEHNSPRIPLWERYIWALVMVWTIIIVILGLWNLRQIDGNTLDVARIQAQTAFEKDDYYRRWNATQGKVYIPVTKDTPPNPYLSEIPERDVTTSSGVELTMVNHAYMTRQVYELAAKEEGVLGNITSLDPIRPESAPDPWETKALEAFEQGVDMVTSVEDINGQDYMRLMRPLMVEGSCLPCHAQQGYSLGDIRGGLSVSVPMAPLRAVAHSQKRATTAGYLVLWAFGATGIEATRRKLKQNELNRQQAAAERERLIVDLDAYAHSVAHDLKTPLSVIIGFATMLHQDLADTLPTEAEENLREIQTSSLKMNSIIEELLILASLRRLEDIDLHPLNMGYIVTDTLARLSPMIKDHHAEIVTPALNDWPVVAGYGPWIEEVWTNYVANAIKYGGEPPHIELGATPEPEHNRVRFWVKDNGPGIKPADQARLFEQFSQLAHTHSDGHGLGLSIVRRIIEKLGGEVGVESAPGVGSTFYFTLSNNQSTGP